MLDTHCLGFGASLCGIPFQAAALREEQRFALLASILEI